MSPVPAPGCRCIACFDGEPHQPIDERKLETALTNFGHPKPQAVTLRVLTTGRRPAQPCDGTMMCDCELCVGQRQALHDARARRGPRQPWEPRQARHAA